MQIYVIGSKVRKKKPELMRRINSGTAKELREGSSLLKTITGRN